MHTPEKFVFKKWSLDEVIYFIKLNELTCLVSTYGENNW